MRHTKVEKEFSNWNMLSSYLSKYQSDGWVFRGVNDYSYHLDSKLERVFNEYNIPQKDWLRKEKEAIQYFFSNYNHKPIPSDGDLLNKMAIMQHYGAPTRLTDWTFNFLKACYFAYDKKVREANSAALWLINYRLIKDQFGLSALEKLDVNEKVADENFLLQQTFENEVKLPLPLINFNYDERMEAQEACFLSVGVLGIDPPPIEQLMQERSVDKFNIDKIQFPGRWHTTNAALFPREGVLIDDLNRNRPSSYQLKNYLEVPEMLIAKIKLPYEWRREVLEYLDASGINGCTLFPQSLDGIGRSTQVNITK